MPPNKGAPGGDGQDFADIEAYGVERWRTGACAQAGDLPAGADQTRVYVPKANGKLRPLGISTVRDRGLATSSDAGAGADL